MAGQTLRHFPNTVALPLVGRERERAVLRDCLDATLAGQGGLVLIGGEAGIGKTALAETALAEATERGALVLVGRCYDLSETPPYGPWREAFDRAPQGGGLPALPTAVLPAGRSGETLPSREAIVARAGAYLAELAAAQPLALLLDDLHWADPASLDLLRFIARSVADRPILLLAIYRTEEVARDHPLAIHIPAIIREARTARIDLRPLDTSAIGTLTAGRYALPEDDRVRLVAYLARRSEGHALFLGELLRTLEGEGFLRYDGTAWFLGDLERAPVPALLRHVIAGRLARLLPETQRLLAIAAVIGQEIPLAVWAAVGKVTGAEVLDHAERAIAARLLAETSDGFGVHFAHALIRETLYEELGALRRPGWHLRAAETLLTAPQPDPDAVAYHLGRAGDTRAFDWLIRAGLRASAAAAWLSAAERFAAAAALPDPEGSRIRTRGWLHYCRAHLLTFSDNAASCRAQEEAAPLALAAGDEALMAHVCTSHGVLRALAGEIRRGMAETERGVAELEALPDQQQLLYGVEAGLAMLATILADDTLISAFPPPVVPSGAPYRLVLVNWFGHTGRYREALALGEASYDSLDADGSEAPPAQVLLGLGHAHAVLGHPDAALSAYARSRAIFVDLGNAHMVGFAIWSALQLAALPYRADDVGERTRLTAESAQAWERARGTMTETAYADPSSMLLALLEGRWAEAERVALDTLTAATAGHAHGAFVMLGVLARQQGNPAAAWAWVRKLHPAGPATEPGDCYFHHGIALQALAADLALDTDDVDSAGEWIAAHARWLDWSGAILWQADHARLRARLAWASGDLPGARVHAERALALATEPRQPLALLAAHRTLGELNAKDARIADAQTHLAAALSLADACAAPYERALTLLALAELHLSEARYEEAAVALTEARAITTDLGATPALARINALAVTLDNLRAAHPLAIPGGLSRRETEVLRLLAAGRSTHQIAEVLYLSPRTVKRHVANVYLKIGAHGRAEATAYALQHHLA